MENPSVLETLHCKKWGPQDGLVALIKSPTRELVCSTYSLTYLSYNSIPPLRPCKSSKSSELSEGIITSRLGGKNQKDERDRLSRMNILVATPGRLLQHMDQTFGFECDNLQMLGEDFYKADAIYVLNGN